MTIKEFRTKLPTLKDEERRIMEPLMGMLCPISVAQMRKFQNDWDFEGNPPPDGFDKYAAAQDKVILECLKIELSTLGTEVRKNYGLAPLTEDMEII